MEATRAGGGVCEGLQHHLVRVPMCVCVCACVCVPVPVPVFVRTTLAQVHHSMRAPVGDIVGMCEHVGT